MYGCLTTCTPMYHVCALSSRQEDIRSHMTGVTDDCELPCRCKAQTQDLWNSHMFLMSSHLSSPILPLIQIQTADPLPQREYNGPKR